MNWARVNRLYTKGYENILAVFEVPGSSSVCERGFSQMKSIKTDIRSCLAEKSLSTLMTIRIHGAEVDEYVCIKC